MAIRNNVAVYIGGINYTHYVAMPFKWGNFLDEQLDEAYISLRRSKRRTFAPLTPVEIHLKNELYWKERTVKTKKEVKRFIIANDKADESPVGSGLYNHELYLIEITKLAECVVVDTCTFTNDLGRNYTKNAKPVTPKVE